MPLPRGLRAAGHQPVAFVELFFDLVFVFAVTQITAFLAGDLTVAGGVRAIILFWLIWWAWTQFTWTLNPADTTHTGIRIVTLGATAAAFVMATAVTGAFGADALWFAVAYVVVRLLGLGLQVRLEWERPGVDHGGVWRWASLSLIGLALVVVGALAEPGLRPLIWLVAIAADLLAAGIAASSGDQVWDLDPGHLSERHGLFVIIAIGESLIVAGSGLAEETRSVALVAATGAAIALSCVLWWSYFGWLKDGLEAGIARATPRQLGPLARDAFSFAHFPLVCGIIGFAVAIKDIVHHPETPLSVAVLAALGLGVALFAGFGAVSYWRLTGRLLVPRLALLAAMGLGLAIAAPLPPTWPLVVTTLALLCIVVVEALRPEPVTHPRAGDGPHARERDEAGVDMGA